MATPIEQLRQACLDRGVHGIRMISRVFRIMDDNRSRTIDREELSTGLKEFGLSVSKSFEDQLFQYLDKQRTGLISFDEFLEALRPPMPQARLDLINQAFDKLDRRHAGFVTIDDLRDRYSVDFHPKYKSGEMTADQVLTEFLDSFQAGGEMDDKVTRNDFINYYSGVSASIDDDEYFVYMMQQAWKL